MTTNTAPDCSGPFHRLLTITEVADMLAVEVRHVRRLVHERRIPFTKWGHLLRFDPVDIACWLDGHRVPHTEPVARKPRGR